MEKAFGYCYYQWRKDSDKRRKRVGKTTLIKLLLGGLQISEGIIERADYYSVYIDQDYSMIDHSLNVIQQAESFNLLPLPEHEVKQYSIAFV